MGFFLFQLYSNTWNSIQPLGLKKTLNFSCITVVQLICVSSFIVNIILACESVATWKKWVVAAVSSMSQHLASYSSIEYTKKDNSKLKNNNQVCEQPYDLPFPQVNSSSTFPIQQEAAVRDEAHPGANEDKLNNNQRQQPEGCDSCLIKSFFPRALRVRQGSVVQRAWRTGQETQRDVADSAISHRMLENSLTTFSHLWLKVYYVLVVSNV